MTRDELIKEVEQNIQQIIESKIPETKLLSQMELFKTGLPFLKLCRPCTPGAGIHCIPESEISDLTALFDMVIQEGRVMKFVPASGSASRMFKPLLTLINSDEKLNQKALGGKNAGPDHEFAATFIKAIDKFGFYEPLKAVLSHGDLKLSTLVETGEYREILTAVLMENGLNYANLPKGLVRFHQYSEGSRTAFEEHLVEALEYCRDKKGNTRIHFTVSPDHKDRIQAHLESVRSFYEKENIRLVISYSIQNHATNTIAVGMDNDAFRDKKGRLLFRPGGHGALIQNLETSSGDIIFLKNIDNVVTDQLKPMTYKFKRLLGGYLVFLQGLIFQYLNRLESNTADASLINEILNFLNQKIFVSLSQGFEQLSREEKTRTLVSVLNRPIRVCGMVKNQGEPGGGPFWVEHPDKSTSMQIVETSQVNIESLDQLSILKQSTHFNPVDIVCGIRDYKGQIFDLGRFVDDETAFICTKSKDGKELKALELPGLWNGAMARWNTVFVQVPLGTFNPVKTVNDLLRPAHLASESS